jgi:hypothetical protein
MFTKMIGLVMFVTTFCSWTLAFICSVLISLSYYTCGKSLAYFSLHILLEIIALIFMQNDWQWMAKIHYSYFKELARVLQRTGVQLPPRTYWFCKMFLHWWDKFVLEKLIPKVGNVFLTFVHILRILWLV